MALYSSDPSGKYGRSPIPKTPSFSEDPYNGFPIPHETVRVFEIPVLEEEENRENQWMAMQTFGNDKRPQYSLVTDGAELSPMSKEKLTLKALVSNPIVVSLRSWGSRNVLSRAPQRHPH